jgi:hypothetical protein
MTRQLLSTSYSCAIKPGLWTIIVVYGFWSQIAGTPRGRQFTDDFDSSSSVGVIDLIFSSAQGWNAGRSSGVTFGLNVPSAAGSTPNRPLTPCPAPFGNQCPVKSGRPSGSRGAGPPGGSGLIVYSGFWALTGSESMTASVSAAVPATP